MAIVESSSGAASAAAMKPATVSAVAGRMSIPPTVELDRVQPVLEPRRDAEVAAAAADRPEQVRVMLGVDVGCSSPSAVTRSAASRESIVRPCLRTEIPDAATERDPAKPDRPGVPETGRQAVRGGGRRVLGGGQAGPGPRGPVASTSMSRLLRGPAGPARSRRRRRNAPAPLCPPLRTASGRPVSRASAMTRATSAASAEPDDDERPPVDAAQRPRSGLRRSPHPRVR